MVSTSSMPAAYVAGSESIKRMDASNSLKRSSGQYIFSKLSTACMAVRGSRALLDTMRLLNHPFFFRFAVTMSVGLSGKMFHTSAPVRRRRCSGSESCSFSP